MDDEEIPGSAFISSGESQYLFLPKGGEYRFVVQGMGTGPATIAVDEFINDSASEVAIYTDIPVSTTTRASFAVGTGNIQDVRITVDTDGDGKTNYVIAEDAQPLTLEELLFNLKDLVSHLTAKEKLKDRLLKKVEQIEKKIGNNKKKQAGKKLMSLEKRLKMKIQKGVLSDNEIEEILILLDEIEKVL